MQLKKITLKDFKSHENSSYEFGQLSYITGIPRLGKTAILEAIEFVLMGTIRGSKNIDHIYRDGSTSCEVELELELDGQTHTLHRIREQQSDKIYTKITFDDESITQKALDSELGLSELTRYSMLHGFFRKQDNTKRREILLSLLPRIDRKEVLTDDEKILLEDNSYKPTEIDLKRAKDTLGKEKDSISRIDGQLIAMKDEIMRKQKQLKEHEALKGSIEQEKDKLLKIKPEEKSFNLEELSVAQREKEASQYKLSTIDREISLLETKIITETICPTCNRKLAATKLKEIETSNADYNAKIKNLNTDKVKIEKQIKETQIKISLFISQQKEKEAYDNTLYQYKLACNTFRSKVEQWQSQLKALSNEIDKLKADYIELDNKKNNTNKVLELEQIISIVSEIPKRIAKLQKEKLDQYLPSNITIELSRINKSGNEEQGVYITFDGKAEPQLSTSEEMELDLALCKLISSLSNNKLPVILIDRAESYGNLLPDENFQILATRVVPDTKEILIINN